MSKYRMLGVIPPMVTPFKENGEVDYDGLRTLVTYLKKEVDGLFINGSYGSGVMMTHDERMKTAEKVMETVAGEIPVVVHVGTADTVSAAKLTAHAASIGAAAVSAVGPYYFQHNEDQIRAFYRGILDAAADTPVYVYNNPRFQGYEMGYGLIDTLRKMGVHGIKDATFDIIIHANYMRRFGQQGFDIALGTEAMWLSACALGCQAFIPGLGNAFPEICRKMHKEGMAGDIDACRATQFKVNEMREVMYLARSTQLAVYAMLEVRGIVKAFPRSPFVPASEEEKKAIREKLVQMGMM